jgi:hypothetical protein
VAVGVHSDEGIARIATLLHDGFDGQISSPTELVPGNGDIWVRNATGKLVYDLTATTPSRGYGNNADTLDRVAAPASAFLTLADELAGRLAPFGLGESITDSTFYHSLDIMLNAEEVNWCDRCKMFALHSTITAEPSNVKESFEACRSDTLIGDAVGAPPEPDLRINDATCTPCPPQHTSDDNGQCVFCPNTIVGNTCSVCPSDVVLDRATDTFGAFDSSASVSGDTCPEVFIVEIQNSQALFDTRDVGSVFVFWKPQPNTKSVCESVPRAISMFFQSPTGFDLQSTVSSTGRWDSCFPPDCTGVCSTSDHFVLFREDIPASGSIRFSTPSDPNTALSINTIGKLY